MARSHVRLLQQSADTALDERDDATALIDWDKLPWVFKAPKNGENSKDEKTGREKDNWHVEHFRATAGKFPHSDYDFKDWHCPQYFSDFPLPPDSKSITVRDFGVHYPC